MAEMRNNATWFLSLSLFCLAGAIVYFTTELAKVTHELPAILDSINQTSEKIEPIINEISGIRAQIPPVLDEIKQIRIQIPPALEEVKQFREQIPPILEEVRQVREQVPPILEQVRITNALIPKVLDEVATTRKAIPPMLERGERMISEASVAGKEASKGAVTGFFTGLITAPFAIIGGAGKKLFGLSEDAAKDLSKEDLDQLEQLGKEILVSDEIGTTRKWQNEKSGYSSILTLKSIETNGDQPCKTIHTHTLKKGNTIADKMIRMCLTEEGNWEEIK